MPNKSLYDEGNHRNIMLEDFGLTGLAVQANQHLIIHGDEGMILDPGGHKVYNLALSEALSILGPTRLRYIFCSHQDPDIVAAINGWLMTTDADAYVSEIWTRFVAHFGIDHLVEHRLLPIPDKGMHLALGGADMVVLPAHFLHSPGNFQVYDPVAKILYSGDLGASLGTDYDEVPNFGTHVPFMKAFHQRYMGSNSMMRAWAEMIEPLEIEIIAPQHGALFIGRDMVEQFVEWCRTLECGVDLAPEALQIPPR